ncbi:hypothetical protein CWC11_10850 [Pseudoalteromonas sp. S3178]|uniref:hypothetical protein n=1 Tax=Pseudoalteromonas sp. S3178 TaxID=579532 RepID=UPI00110AA411|nr:hypothetical protein [Pseudoalteromonas sp. S3178]TMP04865.1 hypothetical protein CWC11_10850 [Pseudoalteromonas sp. S3178]
MKKLIALSLCSLLAACGGGGSESSAPVKDSVGDASTGTVTNADFVIGTVVPLNGARVCADVNQNLVCEESEFLGLTSTSGAYTVSGDYTDTAIIIDTVPEQTVDINTGSFIDDAYTLYAAAGSANVSAVTTMSVDSGYSMQSIADMWFVDLNMVSGDYTTLLESGSPQAILVGLASDYAVKLLQEGESLSGVPQSVSLVADYVYSTLESGVSPADLSFELDDNGQMYLSVPSVDDGSGNGPFIQTLSDEVLVGDWNIYSFARLEGGDHAEATYGKLTIKEGVGNAFCFVDDVISSESVIAADAEQECVDRYTSHTEMIAVGHQKYRFVYGHESDKGSALIFRAFTDIGNDKYVSNGYVWIDNYTAKANEFMGLRARDWYRSVYSGLAQNSAGDYDYAAYMVDFENKMSVEYASGEMVETRLQYLENVSLLPSFEANKDTLYFVDEYASNHISALRVDDYVALAMFKRNEALTLGLLSPNGDIISATKEGDIFNDLLINMVELKK